jgi:predicted RNA-binding protein YlxR (DUF448 family)
MGKKAQRRKHVPQRICVVCRTIRPKRELVRIVRTPEGAVMVDETGKRSGRGAYLCRQRGCWARASVRRQLERALKVTLTAETEAQLQEYAAGLPYPPSSLPSPEKVESEESEETVKGAGTDE